LVAAALVLFSISLTGMRDPSGASLGATLRKNISQLGQGVREELLAAANLTDHISSAVAKATNVHALIRPADYMRTPTITAVPATKPLSISAAPIATQQVASAQTATVPITRPPAHVTNGYAWGNCTWWAAARRAELGLPIPNNWGNAATWAARAGHDGYRVDHTPSPGAIMQTPHSAGGLGHVAIVEQVDPTGTWHISEMNVLGLNIVDHAAKAAAAASSYNFIH
jgi:surface antigen